MFQVILLIGADILNATSIYQTSSFPSVWNACFPLYYKYIVLYSYYNETLSFATTCVCSSGNERLKKAVNVYNTLCQFYLQM